MHENWYKNESNEQDSEQAITKQFPVVLGQIITTRPRVYPWASI
jgi:hypothetical protein